MGAPGESLARRPRRNRQGKTERTRPGRRRRSVRLRHPDPLRRGRHGRGTAECRLEVVRAGVDRGRALAAEAAEVRVDRRRAREPDEDRSVARARLVAALPELAAGLLRRAREPGPARSPRGASRGCL